MTGRVAMRLTVVLACVLAATAGSVPAGAAVTRQAEPAALLDAMSPPEGRPANAVATYVERPPAGSPSGVSDTPLAGFPSAGDYAVLSTGDAGVATLANNSPATSTDNGGGAVRDGAEYDVVVMRVDFETPVSNCVLAFDYQFLSDEHPEFTGRGFGDTFVAELDVSTWTATGGEVRAPHAFVVESVDSAAMTPAGSTGTTYDGAKPAPGVALVRIPTAGSHSLYLSLFDVGDALYDTAVFIDNLTAC